MNEFTMTNIKVGMIEEFTHTVTQDDQDLFAKLSGDINPLHRDKNFALQQGFSGCVVYGMLVASLYSTLAGVYLPGKYCLLQSVNTAFIKPVMIGDKLRVAGKVQEIDETFNRIIVKASIYNQDDKKVSRAVITAGIIE